MNMLDVRTVMFSHLLTDLLCALAVALLWYQNRRRFAGIAFWVLDFLLQAVSALLIILRGGIPDWASVVLSNTLVLAGALLGYMGLERFVGRRSSHVPNYALLAIFIMVHSYFLLINPSLAARTVNVSLGLFIICFQCAWLMLHRVPPGVRRVTREVGLVFGAFCLVSTLQIVAALADPRLDNDFFHSDLYQTLNLILYQMLLILLNYSLALMLNARLVTDLRSQEEKFAKAFRSSPYAITLTRPEDGRILEVNDGFVDLSGYAYAEAVGRTTEELHLWAREEDRLAVVNELTVHKRVRGAEFTFRTKAGEALTGLFAAEVITFGDQVCLLSSISDITARKQAEERLQATTEELQRSNRDLEAFGYVASHDLQEPLRMVSSYAQLLVRRYKGRLDADAEDFIGYIVDGANRMQHMIDDLLAYARVGARGRELAPTEGEQVLAQALRNLQIALQDAHARVTHDALPTVLGDEGQLVQLFQNLIGNAVKFHGPEAPRVHVSVRPEGQAWVFAVHDNGIGIEAQYLDKLFVVFRRLHTAEEYPGSGIGLAICKKVVERHHGRIWIESQPGQGTTVYFTLPGAGRG